MCCLSFHRHPLKNLPSGCPDPRIRRLVGKFLKRKSIKIGVTPSHGKFNFFGHLQENLVFFFVKVDVQGGQNRVKQFTGNFPMASTLDAPNRER